MATPASKQVSQAVPFHSSQHSKAPPRALQLPHPGPRQSVVADGTQYLPLASEVPTGVTAPAALRPRPPTSTLRRPACTHIEVNRVHGDFPCSMCQRLPDLGWVYACQQDQIPGQDDSLPDLNLAPNFVSSDKSFYEANAQLAEYLRMSASIVQGFRAGDYDAEQVKKLIDQRKHVIRTINAKENPSSDDLAPGAIDQTQNIIASVGTAAPVFPRGRDSTTLSTNDTDRSTGARTGYALLSPTVDIKPPPRAKLTCSFQVCHACRPFWKDRPYCSFESVLAGEASSLTEADLQCMPVMDRDIMLNVGLRKPETPPCASVRSNRSTDMAFISYNANGDDDEISVDWTSDTNGESDSSSDHLDSAQLYPCPGALQCPVYSRNSGCAYDVGFDDGRRAINHGFLAEQHLDRSTPDNSRSLLHSLMTNIADTPGGSSSTASTLSLPTPTTAPLTPLLPTDDTFDIALRKQLGKIVKAKSVCEGLGKENRKINLRGSESNSSIGSEVEVDGGVALKEEAVERGVPDIITTK